LHAHGRWFGGVDVLVILALQATCAFLIAAVARWVVPLTPNVSIDLSPRVLLLSAGYSQLSLGSTLVYGYIASTHQRASAVMVPLLNPLQSIPILSLLPSVMSALAAAFPHSNIGLELANIRTKR
jgi:NitT/TauT family transport system permease protein